MFSLSLSVSVYGSVSGCVYLTVSVFLSLCLCLYPSVCLCLLSLCLSVAVSVSGRGSGPLTVTSATETGSSTCTAKASTATNRVSTVTESQQRLHFWSETFQSGPLPWWAGFGGGRSDLCLETVGETDLEPQGLAIHLEILLHFELLRLGADLRDLRFGV